MVGRAVAPGPKEVPGAEAEVSLDRLLALAPTGASDHFGAVVPPTNGARAFGGHLLALALRAAARTVPVGWPALAPHSLHARFVRPGTVGDPVGLAVERVRDGRTTALRRVAVTGSDGRLVANVETAFRLPEESTPDWSVPTEAGGPPCEVLDSPMTTALPLAPFEVRSVHPHVRGGPARLHPYWARLRSPLPPDPVLDACLLVILTDIGVSGSARRPGAPMREQRRSVSLDHALWIHRPFPRGDWVLVEAKAESNAGGRGFARGAVRLADGIPVASFGQEVLLDP
ncbi:acyl-CoA thioesterase domain-containing protein [Pseudonocardia sp. NPDC049154]|uniref:acyl-CoA thioesterase n=1 Tax=Pseudonocardia sp. NPDC049154 TaxID=3155501 RepID=UPI0033E5A699